MDGVDSVRPRHLLIMTKLDGGSVALRYENHGGAAVTAYVDVWMVETDSPAGTCSTRRSSAAAVRSHHLLPRSG